MIELTEDILKMSDNEARKILVNDIYKAKYYIQNDRLIERETKVYKDSFLVS